jgi:hypothetical protein
MLFAVTSTSGFYYGFLGLEVSTATAESGWGLGFVYIIMFLFTCESGIVISLIMLYLFINTYFPYRNNNYKCIERRKT